MVMLVMENIVRIASDIYTTPCDCATLDYAKTTSFSTAILTPSHT